MQLDDDLCLCFHVSKRKVINFVRIEKPVRPSQISECFGAGTGCGWCRPFLEKIFREVKAGEKNIDLPAAHDYSKSRSQYVRDGGGTPPPGSEPMDSIPDSDPLEE